MANKKDQLSQRVIDAHALKVLNLRFPYGTCQCGCGNATRIAKFSEYSRCIKQGCPVYCYKGHEFYLGVIPKTNYRICYKCKLEKPTSDFVKNERLRKPIFTGCCLACASQLSKEARIRNPNLNVLKNRKWRLKKDYNLSLEEYAIISERQKNLCAICHQTEKSLTKGGGIRTLSIDHNHDNGKLRGLLCNKCNRVLGYVDEDIEILKTMIEYLETWNKIHSEE